MRALFDDEAAGRHSLADEFVEPIHWTVRIPRHVVEEFERMAADSEAEQVYVRFQTFPDESAR